MIPILYKLRESVRFEHRGAECLVVTEVPLNVVRASRRAVRVLELCDGKRTLREIARDAGIAREEEVFKICDYFNKKAVLETGIVENQGYYPSVTVIIPDRDRKKALLECIESVLAQDYASDRIEVIVIDDGSKHDVKDLAGAFPCKLLTNTESRGQSYCRNLGVRQAKGEILAFLDSDCVAGRSWLKALVPCFQWDKAGAVGGYVDGYSQKSLLDRYEKAFSPLNLGRFILRGGKGASTFYVPTCNLLVRRKAFWEAGGMREELHVGEDVDFSWKMRDAGWEELYVPSGTVMHKHRNKLEAMLRRRAFYGTSEAILYRLHPDRRKTLQIRPLAGTAFLALCCSLLFLVLFPLAAAGAAFLMGAAAKALRLGRKRVHISPGNIFLSVVRIHTSYFYLMSFHVVRYYLVLLLLLGFAFHSVWLLGFSLLLFASCVDYFAKRPQLHFPAFIVYYALDHISYQLGVLAGCLRARSFRSYLPRFIRRNTLFH
jgi:mycofactocin system glycosyltransferase